MFLKARVSVMVSGSKVRTYQGNHHSDYLILDNFMKILVNKLTFRII